MKAKLAPNILSHHAFIFVTHEMQQGVCAILGLNKETFKNISRELALEPTIQKFIRIGADLVVHFTPKDLKKLFAVFLNNPWKLDDGYGR
jgi:hypothetical protein